MYITRPSFILGDDSIRAYKLQSGDMIYLSIVALQELGYDSNLQLGDNIVIGELHAHAMKRKYHEKYPDKKWWQFWLKQEEYTDGYTFLIL